MKSYSKEYDDCGKSWYFYIFILFSIYYDFIYNKYTQLNTNWINWQKVLGLIWIKTKYYEVLNPTTTK